MTVRKGFNALALVPLDKFRRRLLFSLQLFVLFAAHAHANRWLGSVVGKLHKKVIIERVVNEIDGMILVEQTGLRKGIHASIHPKALEVDPNEKVFGVPNDYRRVMRNGTRLRRVCSCKNCAHHATARAQQRRRRRDLPRSCLITVTRLARLP
ncbi:hypothetical protein EVAR_62655_1 [Eumeta japonica]|uniref:Uncharacterized protein n=1 Tax=Eumeta variegata TaxID=151549 RepID=A0A4C1Z4C4_EUMVA|nr:hypothetical protein EVAR_62655_1 [Eumeta japonica]